MIIVLFLGRRSESSDAAKRFGSRINAAIDNTPALQQLEDIDQYRDDTIKLVEQSLGPDPEHQLPPHPNPVIQSFWDIGRALRATGTPGECNDTCQIVTASRCYSSSVTETGFVL